MKTAVEWLMEELPKHGSGAVRTFGDLFQQAKEMEDDQKKELVVATYTYLKMKDCHLPYGMEYLNKISELDDEAEQYYNETFKRQQK
jgi:hypothetical protein